MVGGVSASELLEIVELSSVIAFHFWKFLGAATVD